MATVIFVTSAATFFLKALMITFIMGAQGFKNNLIINACPQKDVILLLSSENVFEGKSRSQSKNNNNNAIY